MAIRLTPEYKKNMYKIVRNYNRRVKRANTEGKIRKDRLPEKASIYALTHNYSSRDELDKELANLQSFSRQSVRQKYNTTLSEYDVDLIKRNKKDAREFFENRRDMLEKNLNPVSLSDEATLARYEAYVDILGKDLDSLDDQDAKLMERAVANYRMAHAKQGAGYRGFMAEVEWVMDNVGIDPEVKDEFFKKLRKLSPDEFYQIYMENDLITAVYRLADSPSVSEMKLNTTEEDARGIIDALIENVDVMIANAKKKA